MLNVNLPPETEARLKEQAALLGKAPEGLVLEAVQEKLAEAEATGGYVELPEEQWAEAFTTWVRSHPRRGYVADDSREGIYD